MSRLFWKIFLAIFLAQLATAALVGGLMWFHRPDRQPMPPAPPPTAWQSGPPPDPRGPPPAPGTPLLPILVGFGVSLVFAGLLARYLSKPILGLRAAFDEVGRGNFGPGVAGRMGRRRDELADLGRAFDRTAARLKAMMDGQRRLLHDVSHELRSPLARMQLAIDLLRQQPEKQAASLERIERESGRIDRLVEELLTLSRLEAGTYGNMDEQVDIAELLAEIAQDARFEAETRGCQVSFAAADGEAAVQGRADLLQRALENVVRNAVKHTFPGTEVRVVLRRQGSHLHIDVADDGPGVPEAALEAIFLPFVRYSEEPGGYGLGLAIARQVIEAHGGDIRACTGDPSGLRMEIRLPLIA